MGLSSSNSELYIGIDETNCGRFPEIYVAAFSNLKKDSYSRQFRLKKRRNDHNSLWGRLSRRGYSFLFLSKSDHERISKRDFLWTVIASLSEDTLEEMKEVEKTSFIIDGEVLNSRLAYTRDSLAEYLSLGRNRLEVIAGAKYDEIYPIVNLADEIAHVLFRHSTPEKLSRNKHKKNLIL